MTTKRKICILGSYGSGKSSTGNFLLTGKHTFKVNKELNTFTEKIEIAENNDFIVIDTPGFGSTSLSRKHTLKVLHTIPTEIMNFTKKTESETIVDNFYLPVHVDPRMQTIVGDMDILTTMFGLAVVKSLVILVIQPNEKRFSHEQIAEALDSMKLVKSLYDLAGTPIRFVMWDNLEPFAGQQETLKTVSEQQKPYTTGDYIRAHKEIQSKQLTFAEKLYEKENRKIEQKLEAAEERMEMAKREVLGAEKKRAEEEKMLLEEKRTCTELEKKVEEWKKRFQKVDLQEKEAEVEKLKKMEAEVRMRKAEIEEREKEIKREREKDRTKLKELGKELSQKKEDLEKHKQKNEKELKQDRKNIQKIMEMAFTLFSNIKDMVIQKKKDN